MVDEVQKGDFLMSSADVKDRELLRSKVTRVE